MGTIGIDLSPNVHPPIGSILCPICTLSLPEQRRDARQHRSVIVTPANDTMAAYLVHTGVRSPATVARTTAPQQ
jgi:hypothetical protein